MADIFARGMASSAKDYVDSSIAGIDGIISGKNCTIKSTSKANGTTTIVFEWTADDGTTNTNSVQVNDGQNGTNGQDGADGNDGITPTFSIGTVTTLSSGSDATVTLTGTAPNYVLNLGIPKGADGVGGSGSSTSLNATVSSEKLVFTETTNITVDGEILKI